MDCVIDSTQYIRLLDNTKLPIASLLPMFQSVFATFLFLECLSPNVGGSLIECLNTYNRKETMPE